MWDKTQLNWPSLKKELRVVCLGIAKFKDFVIYTHLLVKTGCKALQYAIQKCEFEDAAMVCWIMQLSLYHFDTEFIPGEKNSFADMLSREFIEKHSISALSCNFIRHEEDEVQIETTLGWIVFTLDINLRELD